MTTTGIEIGTLVRKVRGNYDRGELGIVTEIRETTIHPKYGPLTTIVLDGERGTLVTTADLVEIVG